MGLQKHTGLTLSNHRTPLGRRADIWPATDIVRCQAPGRVHSRKVHKGRKKICVYSWFEEPEAVCDENRYLPCSIARLLLLGGNLFCQTWCVHKSHKKQRQRKWECVLNLRPDSCHCFPTDYQAKAICPIATFFHSFLFLVLWLSFPKPQSPLMCDFAKIN